MGGVPTRLLCGGPRDDPFSSLPGVGAPCFAPRAEPPSWFWGQVKGEGANSNRGFLKVKAPPPI